MPHNSPDYDEWSTESDEFSDSDSEDDEPHVSTTSNDDASTRNERSADSPPQTPEHAAEVSLQIPSLRSLLRQLLDGGGVSSSKSPPSRYMFRNTAKSVCDHSLVREWIASPAKDCFVLRLPDSLQTPFIYTSIGTCLTTVRPDLQYGVTMMGYDGGARVNHCEYLLASICYQILGGLRVEDLQSDFIDDLSDAFKGYNYFWRETMLWTLFKHLLISGMNEPRLFFLAFPSDPRPGLVEECISTITRFVEFAKAGERDIKFLISLGINVSADFSTPYSMTVSMEEKGLVEGLLADFSSWVEQMAKSRPSIQKWDFKESIRHILSGLLHQPLLGVSYMQYLQAQSLLSEAQLEAQSSTLTSAENFVHTSILGRIVKNDRPLVADVLGLLRCSCRPMTVAELTTALAVARLQPDSDQLSYTMLVDFGFDIRHALAGLVYIDQGSVWPLHSAFFVQKKGHLHDSNWDRDSQPANVASTDGLAWLNTTQDSAMEMAFVCLRYISLWSETEQNTSVLDDATLATTWPFLNYAVTFWYTHYSQSCDGGASDEKLQRLFKQKPDVLWSWLALRDFFQPWGLHIAVDKCSTSLSIDMLKARFDLSLFDAIGVASLASRLAPVVDGHEDAVALWSAWQLNRIKQCETASGWLQQFQSTFNVSSIIKVFSYSPGNTFQLLAADSDFVKRNARALLDAAIRQGEVSIVETCLSHLTLDETIVSELPLVSCVRQAHAPVFARLVKEWPRSDALLRDRLGNELVRVAIKYGNLNILELLLGCEFNVNAESDGDSTCDTILYLATEAGYRDIVQRLVQKWPEESARRIAWSAPTPLHTAVANNFIEICTTLITNGAEAGARGTGGDTPLHIAARFNHLQIIRLLCRHARTMMQHLPVAEDSPTTAAPEDSESSSTCRTPDIPADLSILQIENHSNRNPLEEAILHGHDEAVMVLQEDTPLDISITKTPLHLAVRSKSLATVKKVVHFRGLDVNKPDFKGRTALHEACSIGAVDIVRELVAHFATIWVLDDEDEYPFDGLYSVRKCEALEIAKHLLDQASEHDNLDRCLWNAADQGCEWLVTILLDAGANKNYAHTRQRSVLHLAAYDGHEGMVRDLQMRSVDLDAIDDWDDSPLDDAAAQGHSAIVKILLDAGARDRSSDKPQSGEEPRASVLYAAAVRGRLEVVELLLQRGERFPLDDDDSSLVEITSSRKNSTEMLRLILNYQKEFEGSAILGNCFHAALRNNDTETMELLLQNQANPNAFSSKRLFATALHECAYYSNTRMTKALLSHPDSFQVNDAIGYYCTPLIAAVAKRYPQGTHAENRKERKLFKKQQRMVDYLQSLGADHTISGGFFGSVLNAAAGRGSKRLVEYILKKFGIDPTIVDHEGRSAGHLACTDGPPYMSEKLEFLIRQPGCKDMLWRSDEHGRLPLHLACGNGQLAAVDYLLTQKRGREAVSMRDKDGWTPLHWACRQWDILVIERLIEMGAKSCDRTDDDWSTWQIAVYHGNSHFEGVLGQQDSNSPSRPLHVQGRDHDEVCDSCYVVSFCNARGSSRGTKMLTMGLYNARFSLF